jgi:hypothetical protein
MTGSPLKMSPDKEKNLSDPYQHIPERRIFPVIVAGRRNSL